MSQNIGQQYYFLAVCEGATLAFDMPGFEAERLKEDITDLMNRNGATPDEARAGARDAVIKGFFDNDHVDAVRSQRMIRSIVWLALSSEARPAASDATGFVLDITKKPGGSSNFRFMFGDEEAVKSFTEKARAGRKYIVTHTREEVIKAANRKKTPIPKDPSLEPPIKPKVDRWRPALQEWEKRFPKDSFKLVHECLDEGALFVWRSRQIAEGSLEEIDASLAAMAEYGRLKLPFPRMLAETKDWISIQGQDGPAVRLPARFAIAIGEVDGTIEFYGFVDVADRIHFSVVRGQIDTAQLIKEQDMVHKPRSFVELVYPDLPAKLMIDDSLHRRITSACGERLLELLFLLSTAGVAKQVVRDGAGQPGKKQKGQRRTSPRDYTVIRVPLTYLPSEGGGENGVSGRWVRPHARRAHMWGKHTRPVDEQRWVNALLVGAERLGEGEQVKRAEYRVG